MTDADLLAARPAEPGQRAALLCVPHAGAGASSLFPFLEAAPAWLRPGIVRFAGRESRFFDELATDPAELVSDVVTAACRLADGLPLAVLGHCSGAGLALAALPRCTAEVVAVVAVSAPVPSRPPVPMDPEMPDAELVDRLVRGGQAPERLLNDPEMRELLLPQLRSDFVLLSRLPADPPVPAVPICVVHGSNDRLLGEADAAAWRAWSPWAWTGTVPGGHFLATEASPRLWEVVAGFLSRCLDGRTGEHDGSP